jgi:cell division protein FtsN
VRIVKRLRDWFRKKGKSKKIGPPARPAGSDCAVPKNGRLTLAVIAVLVLMLVLAVLNVRLILDPSIAVKAFGPWVPVKTGSEPDAVSGTSCPAAESKPNLTPPQVTFYSKLVAQEDRVRCPEETDGDRPGTHGDHPASAKTPGTHEAQPAEKYTEKKTGNRPLQQANEDERAVPVDATLPGPDSGTGTYMVQVGAFTNPGIAQQWAARWKSRGYEVMLKPVARPRTGVLYLLYLGKFSSQEEADALVRRLKMKEGITAFRLVVRN